MALTGDQVLDQVLNRENRSLRTDPLGGRTTIQIGGRGSEPTAIYNSVLKDSPAPTLDTTGITATKEATNDLGYLINLTATQTGAGWVRTPRGIRPTINQTTHDLYKSDVVIHFDNQDNPILTNFSAVYKENLRGVKGDKGDKGDGADGLLHLRPDLKIYKAVYRGTNIGVSDVPASPLFRPDAVTYNKTNGDLNVIIPTSGVGGTIVNNQGWVFVKQESDIPRELMDGRATRSGRSIDIFIIDIRTVLNVNAESSNLVTASSIDIGTPYLYDATNALSTLGAELQTEIVERNLEITDIVSGNAQRDIGGGRTEPVGTAPNRRSLNDLGDRLDTLENRPSDSLSETFVETLIGAGVNNHNASETAHAPLRARITALENAGGGGGSSGGSGVSEDRLPSPVRVISVNGGIDIFHDSSAVPNLLKVALRNTSRTDINGPITCTIGGQNVSAKIGNLSINDFNDSGLSSSRNVGTGIETGLHLQINDSIRRTIRNESQSTSKGAAFFSLRSQGSLIAMFSVSVKANLSQMIGGVNLTDILTRGLPALLPNIMETVLNNMTRSYSHVFLQGTDALAGPGKRSQPFTVGDILTNHDLVLTQGDWNLFLSGAYLRIYISSSNANPVNQAALTTADHLDFHYGPFLNLSATSIDADGNTQAIGSIDGDVVTNHALETNRNIARVLQGHLITLPASRTVRITTDLLGGAQAPVMDVLLGVELFTPGYSYELPPGTTVAGLTSPA